MVILITGKKGSGKSYYAKKLQAELLEADYKVHWIDGDFFRERTGNNDYSYEGRKKNLLAAAEEAAAFERKGYVVLMSFIMPLKSLRNKIRSVVEESRVVYIPGGTLWEGTSYERPSERELEKRFNIK